MVVKSLLDIDLRELLRLIEERTGIKLPRDIIETYLDTEHDLLFIRFREPRSVEVGEPLPLKTLVTLFTEEDTGEVTALEVIGISKLFSEFRNYVTSAMTIPITMSTVYLNVLYNQSYYNITLQMQA